jgi:hypothetical protein
MTARLRRHDTGTTAAMTEHDRTPRGPSPKPKGLAMLLAITSLTFAAAVAPAPASAAADKTDLVQDAELTLGSGVANRQAKPLPEKILAGQTVYALTVITGPGGGFVEHVWSCNGKEVAHHYLPVGQSKRWRTWSHHKVGAGMYHLEILGQNGTRLREADFEVAAADTN